MEISRTVVDFIMLYFKKFDDYNAVISNLPSKRIKQHSRLIETSIIRQYEELKIKINCVMKFHAQSYFPWVINIYNETVLWCALIMYLGITQRIIHKYSGKGKDAIIKSQWLTSVWGYYLNEFILCRLICWLFHDIQKVEI